MKKLLLTLAIVTTTIIAGGDIAPVEPVVDPVVADTGDAMGSITLLIMMFLTTLTGLFFVKKEMK